MIMHSRYQGQVGPVERVPLPGSVSVCSAMPPAKRRVSGQSGQSQLKLMKSSNNLEIDATASAIKKVTTWFLDKNAHSQKIMCVHDICHCV